MGETSICQPRNYVMDARNQYPKPIHQGTVINIELAKFATKNIPLIYAEKENQSRGSE